MSRETNGFQAGVAFVVIVVLIEQIVTAHGMSDSSPINWGDIIWLLIFQAVIASCVIELYKYWKNR